MTQRLVAGAEETKDRAAAKWSVWPRLGKVRPAVSEAVREGEKARKSRLQRRLRVANTR